MPQDLFDEPERRAAERIAAARQFVARGKLRDALDALNLAIQLAPARPEAFRQRAEVFERMGLVPQAEADRRRADDLAAMLPPPPPPPVELEPPPLADDLETGEEFEEGEEPEIEPAPRAGRRRGPDIPNRTAPHPWELGYQYGPAPGDVPREAARGPGPGVFIFTIGVIVLFLAVIGVGILLGIGSFDGGDGSSVSRTPFGPTGAAGGEGAGTATPEPTPAGSPSTSGSPYSLASVVSAWSAKGMTVEVGNSSGGFTGFNAVPSEVTMTRGGSTATAAVFVYDSPADAQAEWDLPAGNRPSPKGGRTMPSHVTAWWNANVIVILLNDPGGLQSDALDGFINMGG